MPGHVEFSASEKWEGGKVTRAVGVGGMNGVNKALEFLRSRSVPLAPLDMGPLRSSASIKPATPNLAEGALIFDTPYAAIQHERLDFQHDDGQAKYVEEPMRDNASTIQGLIAKGISDALR